MSMRRDQEKEFAGRLDEVRVREIPPHPDSDSIADAGSNLDRRHPRGGYAEHLEFR